MQDRVLQAGKGPLGFLNPFLYHVHATEPSAFRDILKGHNNGGGLDALLPGFYATKGWDPVTGLGTPNYSTLKRVALALP